MFRNAGKSSAGLCRHTPCGLVIASISLLGYKPYTPRSNGEGVFQRVLSDVLHVRQAVFYVVAASEFVVVR
jgi:hypothetical protein